MKNGFTMPRTWLLWFNVYSYRDYEIDICQTLIQRAMVVLNKKEKGKCQATCQEPLEVIMSEENFKNICISYLLKEECTLMSMRPTETRKCHWNTSIMWKIGKQTKRTWVNPWRSVTLFGKRIGMNVKISTSIECFLRTRSSLFKPSIEISNDWSSA